MSESNIIKRKLDILKFVKTIEVQAFSTTKANFFVQGKNDHQLEILMSNGFQKEILPCIPTELIFMGDSIDSFKLIKNAWDSAIINELGEPPIISIKEWAERTVAIIVNNSSDLKTRRYSNIQYVQASNLRTVVVNTRFYHDEWVFYCYELNEDNEWSEGYLVLGSANGRV